MPKHLSRTRLERIVTAANFEVARSRAEPAHALFMGGGRRKHRGVRIATRPLEVVFCEGSANWALTAGASVDDQSC